MENIEKRNRLLEVLSGKEGNYLYPFFWQHGESREILEEYVERIREAGCGGFCLESRPHPDFLGEGWWRDLEIILGKARDLGMKVWILDDSHFPTGYANGRGKDAPESLRQWFLKHREMDITGPVQKGRIAVGPFGDQKQGLVERGEHLVAVVLVKRCGGKDFASDGRFWNLTDRVREGWLSLDLPRGKYRLYMIVRGMDEEGPFGDYIDLTNPESVRMLVEETYEKHYQRFGHEFGRTITGFFSDEPGFYNSEDKRGYAFRYQIGADMRLPWNPYIEQAFREKLQEEGICREGELETYLPCLWFPCGEHTEMVRAVYMDVLTALYQKNFTGQLAAWCRAHGVEYVGHVIEDNNVHCRLGCGPGHYFRALDGQDMAGIDVVLRQILPGQDYLQFGMSSRGVQDGAFNYYGLGKLGASLAHQVSRTRGRAMCEIYGAYGWGEGVGMMKWLADHMLARGINVFVPHAFSEKTFPDPDCPPHFYARGYNPQYDYVKALFPYLNRMCHLLNGGRPVIRVGILYHGEAEWLGRSVYFHTIGRVLMQNQIDYDVIWTDQLEDTVVENGVIRSGLLELTCLLVPLADRYPGKVKAYVDRCLGEGVLVYQVADELPADSREGNLWRFPDDGEGEHLAQCPRIGLEQLPDRLPGALREMCLERVPAGTDPEEEDTEEAQKWLRYYHYVMEDGRHAFMLFQESVAEGIRGRLRLPVMEGLLRYDGLVNVLREVSLDSGGAVPLKLFPGQSVVFVAGKGDASPEEREKVVRDIEAIAQSGVGSWREPDVEIKVSVAEYRTPTVFEAVGTVPNGKLSGKDGIPAGFSGIIRYDTEWDMTGEELGVLDLGRCREAARVWVNGREAGLCIGEPYYYDIAGIFRSGRNQIRIEVPTTLVHSLCDGFSRHGILYAERLEGPIRFI